MLNAARATRPTRPRVSATVAAIRMVGGVVDLAGAVGDGAQDAHRQRPEGEDQGDAPGELQGAHGAPVPRTASGRTGAGGLEPVTTRGRREHHGGVPAVRPLPETGSIFLDARGGDRALRVSWHQDAGLVVLSLWRDNVCAGSFRLAIDEVPELIEMLRSGLVRSYEQARDRLGSVESG